MYWPAPITSNTPEPTKGDFLPLFAISAKWGFGKTEFGQQDMIVDEKL